MAIVAAVLASAACGGASTGVETSPSPAAASTAELEALFRARTDSARMRVAEADVRFMTGMISHHAQALQMAGLAPTRGASPSVQILTARTINAQQEFGNMNPNATVLGPESVITIHYTNDHSQAAQLEVYMELGQGSQNMGYIA